MLLQNSELGVEWFRMTKGCVMLFLFLTANFCNSITNRNWQLMKTPILGTGWVVVEGEPD